MSTYEMGWQEGPWSEMSQGFVVALLSSDESLE